MVAAAAEAKKAAAAAEAEATSAERAKKVEKVEKAEKLVRGAAESASTSWWRMLRADQQWAAVLFRNKRCLRRNYRTGVNTTRMLTPPLRRT